MTVKEKEIKTGFNNVSAFLTPVSSGSSESSINSLDVTFLLELIVGACTNEQYGFLPEKPVTRRKTADCMVGGASVAAVSQVGCTGNPYS